MPSLADLIRMGKQYVSDALPGGTLNPEVNRQGILDGAALSTAAVPVLGDLLGLGADINRYATDPESRTAGNFALSGLGMLPFVPAMTAWHGSPHKFDKFSLDKIGTGEGAQAYGHGLYLAESPDVANQYATALSNGKARGSLLYEVTGTPKDDYGVQLKKFYDDHSPASGTSYLDNIPVGGDFKSRREAIEEFKRVTGKNDGDFKLKKEGVGDYSKIIITPKEQLYKTDIPDEAVARFLDWDKPLSQQSQEVQAALQKALAKNPDMTGAELYQKFAPGSHPPNGVMTNEFMNSDHAARTLQELGIPGIRYLDGGSRSAGQGSSNFVAFDPEMIRILERNGQATGLEPWKPGEYRLKDLITK